MGVPVLRHAELDADELNECDEGDNAVRGSQNLEREVLRGVRDGEDGQEGTVEAREGARAEKKRGGTAQRTWSWASFHHPSAPSPSARSARRTLCARRGSRCAVDMVLGARASAQPSTARPEKTSAVRVLVPV